MPMFEGRKRSCNIVFDDGEEYEGEVENGKRHGTGKFTFTKGDTYDGGWKEDKQDGKGKLVRSDGYEYEGEFKEDKRHGQGKATLPSGSVYEGQFKNGKRDGTGKYTYHNGNIYEGQWKDNNMHGTGTFSYHNGDVYEGQWKGSKQHGTGTLTHTDGRIYAGEWANDKKHGSGTFTSVNGDKYKRVYINGQRVSSKRVATLINGPPSQRPRTAGGIASVVVLNDEHTECGVCFTAFTTDMSSTDETARRHLPVLSTCGHCYCLGCVRDRQAAISEGSNGVVPERIACMACMKADAFSPSDPMYHRWLIDLLERQFPARND